jgi:hypothetical protein
VPLRPMVPLLPGAAVATVGYGGGNQDRVKVG